MEENKMKIVYVTGGSHWEIPLEPIIEALSEKGHELIKYKYDTIPKPNFPKDIDIVLLSSNAGRPTNLDKHIRTYFIPHGLGLEHWQEPMNSDTKVFLAGKRPWIPPGVDPWTQTVHNWEIVGWAKTDVLFNPRKDRVDYVNNLMANLPYDKSILIVPGPTKKGPGIHWLVDYFKKQKINVIALYRGFRPPAMKYYKNYKHIVFPEIQNLYYLAPHTRVVICSGSTSVGREFYITKIPTIHLDHGFEESLNLSNPNIKNFDRLFSLVWNNPDLWTQPDHVIKYFFEINDGKAVERIIKEIEK